MHGSISTRNLCFYLTLQINSDIFINDMKDQYETYETYETYKSIRKPIAPQNRFEQPAKGKNAYKRPRNKRDIYGEEID